MTGQPSQVLQYLAIQKNIKITEDTLAKTRQSGQFGQDSINENNFVKALVPSTDTYSNILISGICQFYVIFFILHRTPYNILQFSDANLV